jgi:hypothetical protein
LDARRDFEPFKQVEACDYSFGALPLGIALRSLCSAATASLSIAAVLRTWCAERLSD